MVPRKLIGEIRQLHQIKYRNATERFIAEGEKVVLELLQSELRVETLICTQDFIDRHSQLFGGIDVINASDKEMERLSLMKSPNKVLAIAHKPLQPEFKSDTDGVFLMLDSIRDPGNMGTIIRTAEWFGVKEIFCSDDCVEVWNPKVVQGAMGSLFRMKVRNGNLVSILQQFAKNPDVDVVAADLKGSLIGGDHDKAKRAVLVIGSEANGISPEVLSMSNRRVRIPGNGAESLNAAVACGILLYTLTK